jgi:hypothetical protein
VRGCRAVASILLCSLVLSVGCAKPEPERQSVTPEVLGAALLDVDYLPPLRSFAVEREQAYFTRVGFWYESGKHKTTNYRRGTHVPVNTRVQLIPILARSGSKRILKALKIKIVETDQTVRIDHVEHHSKRSLAETLYRMFSPRPLDLSDLDQKLRGKILAGELDVGMTRFHTLLTRGYPPGHRTPDLRQGLWEYWSSRYRSRRIHFLNGRLVGDTKGPHLDGV